MDFTGVENHVFMAQQPLVALTCLFYAQQPMGFVRHLFSLLSPLYYLAGSGWAPEC